jgi:[ribosomal protein S18]-alanine N-acetyltransferase
VRGAAVRLVTSVSLVEVLAGLVALEADLFDDAWDTAALTDLVAGYGRRLHVVGSGADVQGYVLTQNLGDFVDLLRIGTAPSARRGGVATALFDAACADARDEGAARVLLEVSEANAGARAFYDRHGFVEIDRRPGYYRDGSDALVLERTLTVTPGNEPTPVGEGE